MRHQEEITRSAGIVGVITLLSRIMGYARDMVVAYFFGARAETDAFYVAFRIPNLLRRLLAEGSLTVSFIPIFTENLEKKGKEEAKKIRLRRTGVRSIYNSPLKTPRKQSITSFFKLFASGF